MTETAPILRVRDLTVEVPGTAGRVKVVDGVSFDVRPNEVFSVVGESGSGKSLTMLAVMGLLPPGRVVVTGGEIWLHGRNLLTLPRADLRALRGKTAAMIFQDPMTSLNPVLTIGEQIAEAIRIHDAARPERAIQDKVVDLLALVGVPHPRQRARQYPHEFSGGMRQRAMIAMAMANDPVLLIADEPTTALDVTIQAQVMEVLANVRARTGASMILITHDLGLVAETADRVAVMYGGRLVEMADVRDLFFRQRHPYTVGLLASLPHHDAERGDLYSIPGQPPGLNDARAACVFAPRCGLRQARERCVAETPPLVAVGAGHAVACHFAGETRDWAARIHAPAEPT